MAVEKGEHFICENTISAFLDVPEFNEEINLPKFLYKHLKDRQKVKRNIYDIR